ncbi:MAG: glycosyltransferase, partial [Streptococcus salivarius]|nr:glycosyltransferase [Streptococcus salivarius]
METSKSLPKVLVMMATYNGEKYVAEQIESILRQENVEVYLQISDDGSSDGTLEICQKYARCHSNVS